MCEICVFDTEQTEPQHADQVAYRFHEEQGDGIGMVAVYRNGQQFEYVTYSTAEPHWATIHDWFERNYDAWRIVLHGRAGTCGGVGREQAHPIHVDCEQCNIDYVVHNGSIRKHRTIRPSLRNMGHDFTTEVDSEIIAHKVKSLPDTIEDHDRNTYTFAGNLNYLVFSENGIMVRTSRKYHLTDDFTMTCSITEFNGAKQMGFERGTGTEWMLISPDPEAEDGVSIETKDLPASSTTSSAYRGTGGRAAGRAARASGAGRWADDYESQDNVTVVGNEGDDDAVVREYDDLMEDFDHIEAAEVAPGVIEVQELDSDVTEYIFRRDDPRLYYFYSDYEEPDNLDQLEEWADEGIKFEHHSLSERRAKPQAYQDDGEADEGNGNSDEPEVAEVAADATAREVADLTDEVTVEEAAEIADEVKEMLGTTRTITEGTIEG